MCASNKIQQNGFLLIKKATQFLHEVVVDCGRLGIFYLRHEVFCLRADQFSELLGECMVTSPSSPPHRPPAIIEIQRNRLPEGDWRRNLRNAGNRELNTLNSRAKATIKEMCRVRYHGFIACLGFLADPAAHG